MARKIPRANLKDDEWIRENFEKLVTKHGGKYLAVANQEAFVGLTRKEVEEKAQKKHPQTIPSVIKIPRPESLICALK